MAVTVVFSYRNPGRYAFNVLAAALEGEEADGALRLEFPSASEALAEATRAAVARGDRVLVAWSFYSPGLPECAAEHAALKQSVPGFTSIAGGVHATAEPQETLDAGFDWVAIGEGEHTIVEVVRRLKRGEPLEGTPGLARRGDVLHGEPALVKSAKATPVADLDAFPPYAVGHRKFGAIEITRGCIYACRFCQTPYLAKARFRHRSVANVARYAKAMRDEGLRDVRFVSPTSLSYGTQDETPDLAAVEALLAAVREAMGPDGRVFFGTFPSEVRPEHVTVEALRLLKRYVDNDNLILGGQSGSQRVLDESHRGHDVDAIERAARLCVQEGFQPNVDFILGLPGEEDVDVQASLSLMERLSSLGAKVHAHTFMPLPGTPFRRSPAGRVEGEARRKLEVLASSGRVYGQWKKQEDVARELERRRGGR